MKEIKKLVVSTLYQIARRLLKINGFMVPAMLNYLQTLFT